MNTHRHALSLGVALISLLAIAPAALAQSVSYYDFTFSDSANNQVSVTGSFTDTDGVATAGSITVSGPLGYFNGTLSLAALQNPVGQTTTIPNVSGDHMIFDNLVSPASDPVFTSTGALGFVSSAATNPDYWVQIWGNSPGNYSLAEAGDGGQGRIYVYNDVGTLGLTQIPEPSTSAAILGLATLGLAGLRRFRRRLA